MLALEAATQAGARTQLFDGEFLTRLPHYGTEQALACREASSLVEAMRNAAGIILASPGYHGSISGLVKNAVDYTEAMANDPRVYFDGLPVGLIATAYGWQAANSTLTALRSVVHALRGWPTPLGVTINSAGGVFHEGKCKDTAAANQLALMGRQVVEFARRQSGSATALVSSGLDAGLRRDTIPS
jgi:FMN reductase